MMGDVYRNYAVPHPKFFSNLWLNIIFPFLITKYYPEDCGAFYLFYNNFKIAITS